MKKADPRQRPMGKCGHSLTRIQYGKLFKWYCYDGCGHAAEYAGLKLIPRGKSK